MKIIRLIMKESLKMVFYGKVLRFFLFIFFTLTNFDRKID